MTMSKFLDPQNDIAFKRIFGSEKNKDILIHFINDILELRGDKCIREVTFLPTIQDAEIASKKQSMVDVLCKDENGRQIIVEMQVSPQKGFEKRAQYYAAKAYSRQLNKGKNFGSQYTDLKAVVFIAISNHVIFPDKVFYKSDHIILDKDTYSNDLQDFSFTFIELPKFKITDINLLTNIIEKWCFFFKNADSTSEADMLRIASNEEVIERAYEELNQFNWSEDELIIYERETKRIMDNAAAEAYQKELRELEDNMREEQKNELRQKELLLIQRELLLNQNTIDLQHKSSELEHKSSELEHKSSELEHKSSELEHKFADLERKKIYIENQLKAQEQIAKIEIAKKLLSMNFDIINISNITGLDVEIIKAMKNIN